MSSSIGRSFVRAQGAAPTDVDREDRRPGVHRRVAAGVRRAYGSLSPIQRAALGAVGVVAAGAGARVAWQRRAELRALATHPADAVSSARNGASAAWGRVTYLGRAGRIAKPPGGDGEAAHQGAAKTSGSSAEPTPVQGRRSERTGRATGAGTRRKPERLAHSARDLKRNVPTDAPKLPLKTRAAVLGLSGLSTVTGVAGLAEVSDLKLDNDVGRAVGTAAQVVAAPIFGQGSTTPLVAKDVASNVVTAPDMLRAMGVTATAPGANAAQALEVAKNVRKAVEPTKELAHPAMTQAQAELGEGGAVDRDPQVDAAVGTLAQDGGRNSVVDSTNPVPAASPEAEAEGPAVTLADKEGVAPAPDEALLQAQSQGVVRAPGGDLSKTRSPKHSEFYFQQPNNWTCSVASATMALHHWNLRASSDDARHATYEQLVRQLPVNPQYGLMHIGDLPNEKGMVGVLEANGLKVHKYSETASWTQVREELKEGKTVILNGRQDGIYPHFVYIAGIDQASGKLVVGEPWKPNERLWDYAKFAQYTNGDRHRFISVSRYPSLPEAQYPDISLRDGRHERAHQLLGMTYNYDGDKASYDQWTALGPIEQGQFLATIDPVYDGPAGKPDVAEQALRAGKGKAFPIRLARPGDLLFFDEDGDGKADVVGYYTGGGMMIYPSGYFGEVVKKPVSILAYSEGAWAMPAPGTARPAGAPAMFDVARDYEATLPNPTRGPQPSNDRPAPIDQVDPSPEPPPVEGSDHPDEPGEVDDPSGEGDRPDPITSGGDDTDKPEEPVEEPVDIATDENGRPLKPEVVWHPTQNKNSRGGTPIDYVVLHHTVTHSAEQTLDVLNDRGLSVHYIVGKDGTIHQQVSERARAWHAGETSPPDMNSKSVGIEIVNMGDGKDPYTEAQYKALEQLVPYLTEKHDIPAENVVGHKDVSTEGKIDPSENFDEQRIFDAVIQADRMAGIEGLDDPTPDGGESPQEADSAGSANPEAPPEPGVDEVLDPGEVPWQPRVTNRAEFYNPWPANWLSAPTTLAMAATDFGLRSGDPTARDVTVYEALGYLKANPSTGLVGGVNELAAAARQLDLMAKPLQADDIETIDAQLKEGWAVIVNGDDPGFIYVASKDGAGNYIVGDPKRPVVGKMTPQELAAYAKKGPQGIVAVKRALNDSSPPVTTTFPRVTEAEVNRIMPYASDQKVHAYIRYLNAAMMEAEINTVYRQSAFLAQIAHESGSLNYMEEIASGAAYEGRRDLGNIYPGDGVRYKGRGPIQLTGRANYAAASKALGVDLINHPGLAATPEIGFRVAAWYWESRSLNYYADRGNFDYTTYLINGGYNGYWDRVGFYWDARNVLDNNGDRPLGRHPNAVS